jgi:hypothetical protein
MLSGRGGASIVLAALVGFGGNSESQKIERRASVFMNEAFIRRNGPYRLEHRQGGRGSDPGRFTTIDVPGSTGTVVMGISAWGLVGYSLHGTIPVGFYYNEPFFQTFNVSVVSGINDTGAMVGGIGPGCLSPGTGACDGFILDDSGYFYHVLFPGSTATMVFGVTNYEPPDDVGAYTDSVDNVHGFWLGSTIDPPDAVLTFVAGINDKWEMVGRWDTSDGVTHGYLINSNGLQMLDFPDAVSTMAWGIDDTGTIVGEYTDADGVTHGFLLRNGVFEAIDFPDAVSTTCHGVINGLGVVGSYTDSSGVTHGFRFDDVFEGQEGGAPGIPRRFVRIFGATAARTLERLVGEARNPLRGYTHSSR